MGYGTQAERWYLVFFCFCYEGIIIWNRNKRKRIRTIQILLLGVRVLEGGSILLGNSYRHGRWKLYGPLVWTFRQRELSLLAVSYSVSLAYCFSLFLFVGSLDGLVAVMDFSNSYHILILVFVGIGRYSWYLQLFQIHAHSFQFTTHPNLHLRHKFPIIFLYSHTFSSSLILAQERISISYSYHKVHSILLHGSEEIDFHD